MSRAGEISRKLAREAEAVCRFYLSNGKRQGAYWIVGDAENTPGRSLYVRLNGPDHGPGAAGKWTDAATGEHGDLIDLISANRSLPALEDALEEARRFLGPHSRPSPARSASPASRGSPDAARRLFAMGRSVINTLAEAYLDKRGLTGFGRSAALRFHPHCYYWREDRAPEAKPETWPALLANVTDLDGKLTGVHRTWLNPANAEKAPVEEPRKAMGQLLGHGVRFGAPDNAVAIGEGLETMLSLQVAIRALPIVAALSANHLAALILPPGLCRLYVAEDNDAAGSGAVANLKARPDLDGVDIIRLQPRRGDFNDDLQADGRQALTHRLTEQLDPVDAGRWLRARSR